MSDVLAGATKGMKPEQKMHPVAAMGQEAARAVARFIQAVRVIEGVDHAKIDDGVALLHKGTEEILSGIRKKKAE